MEKKNLRKRSNKTNYLLKSFLIWILAMWFSFSAPLEIDAAPRKKVSAAKKKSASKKRKKKKVSRKKKRKKRKARRKKRRRRRRSRKKRHYNPERTRATAKSLIRQTSLEVSALAGLIPSLNVDTLPGLKEDTVSCPVNESDFVMKEYEFYMDGEDEEPADMNTFKLAWLNYAEDGKGGSVTESGIFKKDIMDQIMDWLGTPYLFGGNSRKSIDCSAFTRAVYRGAANIRIPRVARDQIHVGRKIKRKDLDFGDLIFFHTYTKKFPSHVGIYLGDDLFAHASSRYGVTVSSLASPYYRSHYIGGRRLGVSDVMRYTISDERKKDN